MKIMRNGLFTPTRLTKNGATSSMLGRMTVVRENDIKMQFFHTGGGRVGGAASGALTKTSEMPSTALVRAIALVVGGVVVVTAPVAGPKWKAVAVIASFTGACGGLGSSNGRRDVVSVAYSADANQASSCSWAANFQTHRKSDSLCLMCWRPLKPPAKPPSDTPSSFRCSTIAWTVVSKIS